MIQFIAFGLLATLLAYLSQFKRHKIALILSFVIIAYIMGLQDSIAIDFPNYIELFNNILSGYTQGTFFNIEERAGLSNIEYGWYALNYFLGNIIPNYHIVSLTASIFICYALYKMLQETPSKWHWLGIIYFYFMPMRFCMSGIRQGVAMACLMLVILYILKKDWKKILLFAFIGISIHNSFIVSLAIIPVLFINDNYIEKHKKKVVTFLILLYFIVLLLSGQIRDLLLMNFINSMNENAEHYVGYLDDINNVNQTLLNKLFRFINFIFIVIAFYLSKDKSRKIITIYLLSAYTVAVIGENGALARINNYYTFFAIPCLCIMPAIIKNNIIKAAFLCVTFVYIAKVFNESLSHYLYVKYLDYHTILF